MLSRLTFDLHYHTNVHRLPRSQRLRRLEQHNACLKRTGVDYVASTEHAYKDPFDAYLYLREATEDLPVTIIPAVEAICEEGVDIIYLYRSEDDLRAALRAMPPFSWKARDINKWRDDTGAVNIIPHPFTPGKTGLANVLGREVFMDVQAGADYVEIHNGLSLHFLENGWKRKNGFAIPDKMDESVRNTFRLPGKYRLEDTGWAVSSDAHFPQHQRIVGGIDLEEQAADAARQDWFGFLKQRHRFAKTTVHNEEQTRWVKLWHMLQSSGCTMGEAVEKQVQRRRLKFSGPRRRWDEDHSQKAIS